MFNKQSFEAFVESLDLKHFDAQELLKLGDGHYKSQSKSFGLNTFPPEELWPNVVVAIQELDALRAHFGAPVRLLSLYRSPAYNSAIGGARKSQHKEFRAIDFVCDAGTPRDWFEFLKVRRENGFWIGGLGLYRTFVHIDGRPRNATWGTKS